MPFSISHLVDILDNLIEEGEAWRAEADRASAFKNKKFLRSIANPDIFRGHYHFR